MGIRITESTIGEIIGQALKTVVARFPIFVLLEVIIHSPVLAAQLIFPNIAVDPNYQMLVTVLPLLVLGPIGTAALLRIITQDILERPVGLGDALLFGLQRFGALFTTTLLAGLGMMLGFIFCVIPGIYLGIVWSLINQVVVMENLSGSSALGRSKELVTDAGAFGRVFVLLLVIGFLVGGVSLLSGFGLNMAFPHLEQRQVFAGPIPVVHVVGINNYPNFAIVTVATVVLTAVVQAFYSTCVTLLYFDLRNRKEAFNIEEIGAWSDQYRSWRDEPESTFDAPPESTGIKPTEPPVSPPPDTDFTEKKP